MADARKLLIVYLLVVAATISTAQETVEEEELLNSNIQKFLFCININNLLFK